MKQGSKTVLLILSILALLGLVLLAMMAWPLSGYDLTLVPKYNLWFYLGVLSIAVILLALLYVIIHVVRQPTRGSDLLDKKDGGTVRVSAEALRSIAERTAKLRPEVADATAEVYQNKKDTAVDLVMNLKMKADSATELSVRTIAEDIKQDISREIQNFSGYPLADFHLNVTMDDAEKRPVQALAKQAETVPAVEEKLLVEEPKDAAPVPEPVSVPPVNPEPEVLTEEPFELPEALDKGLPLKHESVSSLPEDIVQPEAMNKPFES